MDAAIMQKLLPKLHGSKKKLGPVLTALIRLCLKEGEWLKNDPIKAEDLIDENAIYPRSLEKLARMRKRLGEHGFTSFAEA
jgi:5-methylcytosine-specific restriction protein B